MYINIEVFYKLILSFWVCIVKHAQITQNKFAYLCNISRRTWGMKLIFCLEINIKVFHKLIVLCWVCISRHAQSTQNNKFAISLQYLKENVKDEVDLPQTNIKAFFKLKFVLSLQFLRSKKKYVCLLYYPTISEKKCQL